MTTDPVLGVAEVAEMLRCKPTTVEDRARRGDLPGLKFGDGGWVFPIGALLARLDELALEQAATRRAPPAPKPAAVLQSVDGKRKRRLPTLPSI